MGRTTSYPDMRAYGKYTYDSVGNRISSVIDGVTTSYVYDEANRHLQSGDTKFQYDDNGNRTCMMPLGMSYANH